MAKRKKSNEITDNDGRKTNKRLPPKVQLNGSPTSKPARVNNAKKAAISRYSINAMKDVFGSEQDAMRSLAQFAKEGSLGHMKLLLEYGFGKPEDIDRGGGQAKITAPVINFYGNTTQDQERTIDIEAEDDIEDAEVEEDE
jgi:hypothetical protein